MQRVSTTIKQGGREAHSQDWLRVETLRDADGNTFTRTNVAFVELATGMHYRENGQWLETRELIEGFPDGAIARRGPHKVIFAPNLNTAGAIELETPAGQRLRSHVLGLAYVDVASGKSVFIGEIKDCAGEILGANQVIYSDAFHGVKADVRYTYRKSGFEQDIILREQPPTPESFGMDRRTTRLQVYTEFLSPPMPTKAIKPIRETMLTDEALDFGGIQMIRGRAFSIADEDKPFAGVSTGKQWLRVEERDLLVEEVEFPAIEREMADLPAPKRSASLRRNSKHWAGLSEPRAFGKKELPKSPQLRQRRPATMQLASARPPQPGFVLDYVIVLTSITDYTFKGDTTYHIKIAIADVSDDKLDSGVFIRANAPCP